jgi:putative FmdB family regulatory protein
MPTYDYVCDACEHAFEQWQSFKDDALTKCPACKKSKLRRLLGTGAAIVFKGSGFYDTDYRQKDEAKKAERAKPKADGGKAKADAKPEAKSDAAPAEAKPADSKPAKASKAKKDE